MSDGGVVAADHVAGRGADTAGTAAGLEVPHDGREGDDSIVDGSFEVHDGPPAVVSEPEGFSQVGELASECPACGSDAHVEPTSVVVETLAAEPACSMTTPAMNENKPPKLRQLDSHKVNGLNEVLRIEVLDEPGSGGANHLYGITSDEPRRADQPPAVMLPVRFQNGPISEAGVNGVSNEALLAIFSHFHRKEVAMHYRNGRPAQNGDKIVQLGGYGSGAQVVALGVLHDATPGNDHCNGNIAPIQNAVTGACLCDCLHVDDLAAILAEKGLDKRPPGK